MMMIYGMFVFELKTLPYQQLRHSLNWRHVKNDRINRSAKWQYIGAGRRRSTLTGCSTLKSRAAMCLYRSGNAGIYRASLAFNQRRGADLRDVCADRTTGHAYRI